MRPRLLTLAILLAPCALASNPKAASIACHFSYTATVSPPRQVDKLDIWLPIPSDDAFQKVTNLRVESPAKYRIGQEPKFGNQMVYVRVDKPTSPVTVQVSFDVNRIKTTATKLDIRPASELVADRLVPTGEPYADIARKVLGSEKLPEERIRSLFDHVVGTMQYDYKKESPHYGDGDVAFVCDYKKGNCSDLHSYLISLARSVGIPAFIEYGFPLTGIPTPDAVPQQGKIGGYHCWAWVYDRSTREWLPVDASDGRRWLDAGKPAVEKTLVGSLVLPRSAVALSRGRDLTLSPPQHQGPLNNFIYPYAEADGAPTNSQWQLTYSLR